MKPLRNLCTTVAVVLGMTVLGSGMSSASVVVDPAIGGSFQFDWDDGLGPIDGIDGGDETEWSMTVGVDSTLSVISAQDEFVPGDVFELVFDGVVIPWGSESTTGGGFFLGELTGLFLSAGLHTFSLNVTELALNNTSTPFLAGAATMRFGTASPASVVPVPPALPLALAAFGLLGLVSLRRRRPGIG